MCWHRRCRVVEEEGTLLDAWLPHGLRLMQQSLALTPGAVLELVVPADVDAVCDLYINRGAPVEARVTLCQAIASAGEDDQRRPARCRLLCVPPCVGMRLCMQRGVWRIVSPYACAGQDAADPYWARPWPSAVALAQELLRRPDLVAGRRVCEVGAGLGVATIAAALAGARRSIAKLAHPSNLGPALQAGVCVGGNGATGKRYGLVRKLGMRRYALGYDLSPAAGND
jgi:hypothetical protein